MIISQIPVSDLLDSNHISLHQEEENSICPRNLNLFIHCLKIPSTTDIANDSMNTIYSTNFFLS